MFAGTICREVYRTYILARRVSFLFFFLVLCESVLLTCGLKRPASASAERSNCETYTVCANRSSLFAVWPYRRNYITLVILARSAKYASNYDKCSTQRVQRIKTLIENRVLETRAHLSRRLPHLVSELSVKIDAERQRSVWAGRLEVSLGSSKRR